MFHTKIYQRRIVRAFNKRVKLGKIKAGDMVLKHSIAIVFDLRGKFRPNWKGSYLVKIVLPIEIEIKYLRVVIEAKTPESEWPRKRYDHLVSLDEKRMDALFHT